MGRGGGGGGVKTGPDIVAGWVKAVILMAVFISTSFKPRQDTQVYKNLFYRIV